MSKVLFSKGECFVFIGLLDRVLQSTTEMSSDWLNARGIKDFVLLINMTLGKHSLAELKELEVMAEEAAEEPIVGED